MRVKEKSYQVYTETDREQGRNMLNKQGLREEESGVGQSDHIHEDEDSTRYYAKRLWAT